MTHIVGYEPIKNVKHSILHTIPSLQKKAVIFKILYIKLESKLNFKYVYITVL